MAIIKTVLLGALLFFVFSCTPRTVENTDTASENAITALAPSPAVTEEPAETENSPGSQLVLERGNRWTAGIPGFGENALRAFTGEYRIPGNTELVQIWLTRELLYYEGWERQDNAAAALYTSAVPGFTVIDPEGIWTVIVYLPTDLDSDMDSRLLNACIERFSVISTSAREMSLPAIIPY
jgi:hypothetical protein